MNILKYVFSAMRIKSKRYSSNRLEIDSTIASSKPTFQKVVLDMQSMMMNQLNAINQNGVIYELGAGVIPLKRNFQKVISTDVIESAQLDGVLDATKMNLDNDSTNAFLLQNTFHHLNDADKFFKECIRVLKVKGQVIIIDPYWNLLSSLLYKNLFRTEDFDKNGNWSRNTSHEMFDANQALSYIVFNRDSSIFKEKYPNFDVVKIEPLNFGIRYIATGGLNFPQVLPKRCFSLLAKIEYIFPSKLFGIHVLIVLEKKF